MNGGSHKTTPEGLNPFRVLNYVAPFWFHRVSPGAIVVEPHSGFWIVGYHSIHGFAPMATDVEPRSGF